MFIIILGKYIYQKSLFIYQKIAFIHTSKMQFPIDTNIFSYSRSISVIKIAYDKFEEIQSYYQFMYKVSKESSEHRMEIIRTTFFALILEIISEYEKVFGATDQSSSIKVNNLSDSFFRVLATNYKTKRSFALQT